MTKARGDLPDTNADLSEAARAVVRDAGDPRTDAYLAALGLVDGPAPEAATSPLPPADLVPAPTPAQEAEQLSFAMGAIEPAAPAPSTDDAEVATLRARVAELEGALAASAGRTRILAVAVAVALIAVVVLLAALLANP